MNIGLFWRKIEHSFTFEPLPADRHQQSIFEIDVLVAVDGSSLAGFFASENVQPAVAFCAAIADKY